MKIMNSSPILLKAKKISILIDSKSFNNRLRKNDRLSIAILSYLNSEYFEFTRTPLETINNILNEIPEYNIERDETLEYKPITIYYKDSIYRSGSHYKDDFIKMVAGKIFKKEIISKEEFDTIESVFIQAILNIKDLNFKSQYYSHLNTCQGLEEPHIYITENQILLDNRYWFENNFPGYPLNIVSIKEASLLLDAFFKRNDIYLISSGLKTDRFLWYWYSMRLKIPHYNFGSDVTNSIANRLYFILMALDEITIQYYLGSNNVTMDTTIYHFNYLISLVTGIFDSLALETNNKLNINCQKNEFITLSNARNGGSFLTQIRDKNPDLRNHISNYGNFIKLFFSIRDIIIHREGLRNIYYSYKSDSNRWEANLIKIDERTTYNFIRYCKDTECKDGSLTKWGVYKLANEYLIEPHHFSIEAISMLVKFVDKYLKLLGNSSFIEDQKQQNTDFVQLITLFEENHLGF